MEFSNKVSFHQAVESSIQLPPDVKKQDKRIQKISLEKLKEIFQNKVENESFIQHDRKKFTLLFTGDTHSHLEPSFASFVSDKELGGVVRRIQYLEQIRQISDQPILVLDAGDFLQGTAYFELFKGEAEVKFMNLSRYHIITLGNHDFDKGWPPLKKLLKQGEFDAVCSNIFPEENSKSCLPPYQLLEIEGSILLL